jgi:ribose 5-phosphate isomerase B
MNPGSFGQENKPATSPPSEAQASRRDGLREAPCLPATGLPLKLVIGNDHAGFRMKGHLIEILNRWGHSVKDVGACSEDPVDFPDIVKLVCRELKGSWAQRGIILGGTGVGACIAANKIRGIRAAVCHDAFSASQCVEHDDVNVLCMGAWIIGPKTMELIVGNFLSSQFSTEEHFRRRVKKLEEMDGSTN